MQSRISLIVIFVASFHIVKVAETFYIRAIASVWGIKGLLIWARVLQYFVIQF